MQAFVESALPNDVFADSFDDGTVCDSIATNSNVDSIQGTRNLLDDASPAAKKQKSSRPDYKKMQADVSLMVENIGITKEFLATQSDDNAKRYALEKEETLFINLERIKSMIATTREELKTTTDTDEKLDLANDLKRLLAQKEKYFNEL